MDTFSSLTSTSKFCIKVSMNLYFPSHTVDLVYIWYDDRYWSKVLFTTIPIPAHDLKVKVTDLELEAIIAQTICLLVHPFVS